MSVAVADEWGDTPGNLIEGTGPHPDGSDHTYCLQPLDDSALDNIYSASNSLGNTTDASVWLETSCDYLGQYETDVVWDTVNLSGDKRGSTSCDDWANDECDQAYVELDVAKLNEGSNDELDTTKTACHELGHTVGLTHHDNGQDCMINDEIPNTELQWRRYGTHHREHIDDWF